MLINPQVIARDLLYDNKKHDCCCDELLKDSAMATNDFLNEYAINNALDLLPKRKRVFLSFFHYLVFVRLFWFVLSQNMWSHAI